MRSLIAATFMLLTAAAATLHAEEPPAAARRVYFGDLHLHTAFSLDSFILNGRTLDPSEAYRFARGEAVSYMGRTIRRSRPLDFIAITDHVENLGLSTELADPRSAVFTSKVGRIYLEKGPFAFWNTIVELIKAGKAVPGIPLDRYLADTWQKEIDAANAAYQPGRFTTFIGFEWTSHPEGENLHRNVIFRDHNPPAPFSSFESQRPEDLWSWLEHIRAQGFEALAIPHNGNVSNGRMYRATDSDGKSLEARDARRRIANEPLSEIVQSKGQSEAHPELSPADRFANFEVFPHLLASERVGKVSGSYVREAYGLGLLLSEQIGVNPFQFGVVGGTDFHNGITTAAEAAYAGDMIGIDPASQSLARDAAAERLRPGNRSSGNVERLETSSGALTGVWAEENTRPAIYAALRRKETFATSGPHIQLRFFAGWSFPEDLVKRNQWVSEAYRTGVPMGSELAGARSGRDRPRFVIWARKDPDGATLERLQVIKVWAERGAAREKVFDVRVRAGSESPGAGGAAELSASWQDPEFDAAQPALYYVRALEVPTPRWSTLLAWGHGLAPPPGVPTHIQERAWSSPIWYVP